MDEAVNYIFSGQGSQEEGMGREIMKNAKAAQIVRSLTGVFGMDMENLVCATNMDILKKTRFTQPAIFAVQAAYFEAVRDIVPDLKIAATAGNSLGTYMSLAVSGSMDLEGAARLLDARAQAMGIACERRPSTLRAFRADRKFVEQLISRAGNLWVALVNTPGQIIVGGTLEAFANLDRLLAAEGYNPEDEANEFKMKELEVEGAFHTEIMRSGIDIFEKALEKAEIRSPELDYFSDTSGKLEKDPDRIRSLLLDQITQPVEWEKCIRSMAEKCTTFLEASNRCVVAGMIEAIDLDYDVEMSSTLEEIEDWVE